MKNKELKIALPTYIAFKHNQDEFSGFIDGYKQCQEDMEKEPIIAYSSFEVCFNIKLKRKGIMKWLENKNIIKPKTEWFALTIRDLGGVDILSSNEEVFTITNTKVHKLH